MVHRPLSCYAVAMIARTYISQEKIKEHLNYNPETGVFIWIKRTGRRAIIGRSAGALNRTGYIQITLNGKSYLAHRLAFVYMTGDCPLVTDHINRKKDDNRWDNLRDSNFNLNASNRVRYKNKSGFLGVILRHSPKKTPYMAQITINGKVNCLGYYRTGEEAHEAYKTKAMEVFGEHVCFDIQAKV